MQRLAARADARAQREAWERRLVRALLPPGARVAGRPPRASSPSSAFNRFVMWCVPAPGVPHALFLQRCSEVQHANMLLHCRIELAA